MCVRENLTTELIDIKSYLLDELEADFIEKGFQKFRARQVYRWLFKGVESFDDMTDLSVSFREQLKNIFYINTLTVERLQISKLDGTRKYLWKLRDGNCVESVLMKYNHGNTICISSQVGCRMGCKFCASTIGGLVRNLNPSELIDQVIFTEKDSGEKISNIVLMGIGEPLDNLIML